MVNVGDAINPDRPCPDEAPEEQRKISRRCTRRKDHLRSLFANDPRELSSKGDELEFVPAGGIIDEVELVVGYFRAIGRKDCDENNFIRTEGREQPY